MKIIYSIFIGLSTLFINQLVVLPVILFFFEYTEYANSSHGLIYANLFTITVLLIYICIQLAEKKDKW